MRTTLHVCVGLFIAALAARGADKTPFKVTGLYTETCACHAPCACELTGDMPSSCQGVGAISISSGRFGNEDISGVKFAYATKPGQWVRVYIDAPDAARRAAAEKFTRSAFAAWGTMEAVKDAKIEISGQMGNYTVAVDDGKTMAYTIAAVMGGDGKEPLAHHNTHSTLSKTFLQAKSSQPTTFHDDTRSFEIEAGRNGYFNDKMKTSGSL